MDSTNINKNQNILVALGVSTIMLIALSTPALAGWRDDDDDDYRGRGWHNVSPEEFADKLTEQLDDWLDLNDDQEEKIAVIFERHQQNMRDNMDKQMSEIKSVFTKDNLTAAEIREIMARQMDKMRDMNDVNQMGMMGGMLGMMGGMHGMMGGMLGMMGGMHDMMLDNWSETLASIHAVLTPEQREKAAEMMASGRWRGHNGMRKRRGGWF